MAWQVELLHLKRYRFIFNIVINLGRASPVIATVVTCIVFSVTSTLRADVVLPVISLFQVITLTTPHRLVSTSRQAAQTSIPAGPNQASPRPSPTHPARLLQPLHPLPHR